jgi:tRNA uridine 5-carboxymethylaminomethyl modification enzyme
MGKGYELGLIPKEVYQASLDKHRAVANEIDRLNATPVVPNQPTLALLSKIGITDLKGPTTLGGLLRRPEIRYPQLIGIFNGASVPENVAEGVEIEVKYEAFIQRQNQMVARQKRLENYVIPNDMRYAGIPGLSHEEVQKLEAIRPATLGQALRISGVTPAAVSILMLLLERRGASPGLPTVGSVG